MVGIILVCGLWALALLAAEAGVDRRLVGLAVLWGFLAPGLGLAQAQLLPGAAHGVIQVLHLSIGLGALGQADNLTTRIRQARQRSLASTAPETRPLPQRRRRLRVLGAAVLGPITLLLVGIGVLLVALPATALPPAINMGSVGGMAGMAGMDTGSMPLALPIAAGTVTPLTSLVAPLTAAHTSSFTLTAQPAQLTFGPAVTAAAWTFNGTAPGPVLRVQQGDLVVVTLINHLPVSTSIHWHGVAVPNAADGVAGLTQDAVKPGASYTYRFIAKDAGTYWYHAHQNSQEQTERGLFGMFIVAPTAPAAPDDVDVAVALHNWQVDTANGSFGQNAHTINDTTGTLHIPAQSGQWVRLRIVNTGGSGRVTLVGAPFTVVALDGHDLQGPAPLTAVPLQIGDAQRYDIRFQMPASGAVALLLVGGSGQYQRAPAVVVGSDPAAGVPNPLPPVAAQPFDLSTYGSPGPAAFTPQGPFDIAYTMTLGSYVGVWNGRLGQVWTLNGQAFPQTPAYVVTLGQRVVVHIINSGTDDHTMHLHGHSVSVLTRNGQPLRGSLVVLDTLLVGSKESYDIAFTADNPGLWMFHCHNLYHANWGMDMMLVYPNIATPYFIGTQSGNEPD